MGFLEIFYLAELFKKPLHDDLLLKSEKIFSQRNLTSRFFAIIGETTSLLYGIRENKVEDILGPRVGGEGMKRLVTQSIGEKSFAMVSEYEDAIVWKRNRTINKTQLSYFEIRLLLRDESMKKRE